MKGCWEEMAADPPIELPSAILIPIARIRYGFHPGARGGVISATKSPEAIVIVAPSGATALGMDGEEIPLDQILKDLPLVEEILRGLEPQMER